MLLPYNLIQGEGSSTYIKSIGYGWRQVLCDSGCRFWIGKDERVVQGLEEANLYGCVLCKDWVDQTSGQQSDGSLSEGVHCLELANTDLLCLEKGKLNLPSHLYVPENSTFYI